MSLKYHIQKASRLTPLVELHIYDTEQPLKATTTTPAFMLVEKISALPSTAAAVAIAHRRGIQPLED